MCILPRLGWNEKEGLSLANDDKTSQDGKAVMTSLCFFGLAFRLLLQKKKKKVS